MARLGFRFSVVLLGCILGIIRFLVHCFTLSVFLVLILLGLVGMEHVPDSIVLVVFCTQSCQSAALGIHTYMRTYHIRYHLMKIGIGVGIGGLVLFFGLAHIRTRQVLYIRSLTRLMMIACC